MERRAGEIVAAESRNTGKPIGITTTEEIPPMVDQIRFFAGAARVLEGRAATAYMAGHPSFIRREPIGVCAQVTPWVPAMVSITGSVAAGMAVAKAASKSRKRVHLGLHPRQARHEQHRPRRLTAGRYGGAKHTPSG